jgi:8-oxo-dGTP pyrophosphatase MutT (NUDIX family)
MAFPGGRREEGDSNLADTARRETYEEIGVDLPHDTLLGVLDDLAPQTPTLPPVVVRPFVFGLPKRPRITMSSEVAGYVWTPLEELPRLVGETDIVIRGVPLTLPAYLIGPHVVWGMTHRIVKGLLELAV